MNVCIKSGKEATVPEHKMTDAAERAVPAGAAASLREVGALFVTEDGAAARTEVVAVESRIDVVLDGAYWASFAASPQDLEDFAYGLLLSHGLISHASEVTSVDVREVEGVLVLDVRRAGLRDARAAVAAPCVYRAACPHAASEAVFPGFEQLACQGEAAGDSAPKLPPHAIFNVSRSLLSQQGMHRATGATHAAVFADREGVVVLMREDVGRHNAVDKLIGVLAREGVDASEGFVYLSSRCALELVAKCARAGVRVVAAVSAPTSAVIDFAEAAGITLCAFAREGRFTVYTHPERLEV